MGTKMDSAADDDRVDVGLLAILERALGKLAHFGSQQLRFAPGSVLGNFAGIRIDERDLAER